MEHFFEQLGTIEADQKRLEQINNLQEAFNDVKASYSDEYNSTLSKVLEHVTTKMKKNVKMREAVEIYVNNYVCQDKKEEATEAMYNMLAAELIQTYQALSHASCMIS